MIRTGEQYRDSIRDGRRVWINGERVQDVTRHPMFRPAIDVRASWYDMQHDAKHRATLVTETEKFGPVSKVLSMPYTKEDWHEKRAAVELMFGAAGGFITRYGDPGELWALHDGEKVIADLVPEYVQNVRRHIDRVIEQDLFTASANTDPKGDRSKRPQDQDPDMLLRVVKETDAGIIVRGAKYETAAAYANQAFTKPTIANWGDSELSDYAVGFMCNLSAPNLRFICRTGFAGNGSPEDYPLSSRFDEVDALIVFDDVLIPWEDVFFCRQTNAATYIRSTLHRYVVFTFVMRAMKIADMLIGASLLNVRQTGLEKQPAVQEKLAHMAVYREGINAYLTAAIASAERSPGGLMMPAQSFMMTGRVFAVMNLHEIVHIARELCGGQVCITPDIAAFRDPETAPWLEKYYTINESWQAEDRRKLLAYARDLINSDFAGHQLSFNLFSHSPPYALLGAVYRNFPWSEPVDFVRKSAGLSDRVK